MKIKHYSKKSFLNLEQMYRLYISRLDIKGTYNIKFDSRHFLFKKNIM